MSEKRVSVKCRIEGPPNPIILVTKIVNQSYEPHQWNRIDSSPRIRENPFCEKFGRADSAACLVVSRRLYPLLLVRISAPFWPALLRPKPTRHQGQTILTILIQKIMTMEKPDERMKLTSLRERKAHSSTVSAAEYFPCLRQQTNYTTFT